MLRPKARLRRERAIGLDAPRTAATDLSLDGELETVRTVGFVASGGIDGVQLAFGPLRSPRGSLSTETGTVDPGDDFSELGAVRNVVASHICSQAEMSLEERVVGVAPARSKTVRVTERGADASESALIRLGTGLSVLA